MDPELVLMEAFEAACHLVENEALPMDTSTFFSGYVTPNRPAGTRVDLKKTRFKKLSKFMKEMTSRNRISTKARGKGGVVHLTRINRTHGTYKAWRAHGATEAEQSAREQLRSERREAAEVRAARKARPPMFEQRLRGKARHQALLTAMGLEPNGLVAIPEMARAVRDYIDAEDLTDPHDRSCVVLDAPLAAALLDRGENIDVLPKREIPQRLQSSMKPYYVYNDGEHAPEPHPGHPPRAEVVVERRGGGRKAVTRVLNLSQFGYEDKQELTSDLANACASAASVRSESTGMRLQRKRARRRLRGAARDAQLQRLKQQKRNEQLDEVVIQGAFADKVVAFLTDICEIPASLIDVTDKRNTGKKGGRGGRGRRGKRR